MKKRILLAFLIGVLAMSMVVLTGCGGSSSSNEGVTIAIPNDPTNEARALLLLDANGYIKLSDDAGVTATIADIEDDNGIEFKEVEAAQVPSTLEDVDYGVINANYAISAGLSPTKDALLLEDSAADYANVVAVKEGNENTDKTKALVAAMESQQVADYIDEEFDGAVISVVDNPGDGYDDSVDYDALSGTTITVAASPTPHADILKVAQDILADKGITLEIEEFTDYVQPNNVVESGEVDANYFQHIPYMEDFNEENGTHIVSVAEIHIEPMGMYAGKQDSLDGLQKLSD